MYYRRRTYRRKPQRRHRTIRRRRVPIKTLVNRAISRRIETKCKYLNVQENALNPLSTRVIVYDPMQISNGTSFDERVGNRIRSTGLMIKGQLFSNTAHTPVYVRMLVFKAKDQQNFTDTDPFFLNANGAEVSPATLTNSIQAMYFPFNKRLIIPLYSRMFKIMPMNTDISNDGFRFISKFIKLRNNHIYEDLSAGGDNNVTNRIHIAFFVGDVDSDDSNVGIELSFFSRFYYKDS